MSGNLYFDDFRIPPDSPLLRYLDIKPGSYDAKWDASSATLLLKKKSGEKITTLNITFEQLNMILMTVQSQRDKFTAEDLEIIEQIKRKKSPSVVKDYESHHIIPIEICQRSLLVIRAKKFAFDEDKDPNRITLPVTFHRGSHPRYSDFVQGILEDEWADLIKDEAENDREYVLKILYGAIGYFKDKLREMSKKGLCKINQMFM
ncbi:MAG: AHH domain-containing protein [Microcoleus sp. PH2017_22_RUC_O_B]|uniref:AHH domain-containing protein n=1 Tax=unclassified Microcoleus TaxID=2642155 RepID=UPI001DCCEB6C|nr:MULTISPECIES: AHH domain-containing protein [unclassified Microcoleus]MCC3528396.1 AHH domain-containing protein [Microcoleus sp. PH2017_21_RUC_O_A]MCC3540572.1 AHH domain-containing protein [Microcoleus sp. PH2017_22_RUC_O_B]